jgi:MYXO-CTERM domain-containing protein
MKSRLFVALASAMGLAAAAHADLTGNTVTAQWRYPDFASSIESHDVVVGAGVELPFTLIVNDDKFDIDLSGDTVTFLFNSTSNWSQTSYNGWHFSDTNGTIPDITGYTVDEVSAGVGNVGAIITESGPNHFAANFAGVTVAGDGDFIRLRVSFVPAPGALAVLGLGGLAAIRRRR